MPNIMIVGNNFKKWSFSVSPEYAVNALLQNLGFKGSNTVLTIVDKDYNVEGERILMYGFDYLGEARAQEISYDLMKKTGLVADIIKSKCQTVGKEQVHAPHLVIMTTPRMIDKFINDLRFLQLGFDTEIHLVGSNVAPKAQIDFYVRIKLLEEEIEYLKDIIVGLMGLGIPRELFWVDIIYDFVPGQKIA